MLRIATIKSRKVLHLNIILVVINQLQSKSIKYWWSKRYHTNRQKPTALITDDKQLPDNLYQYFISL